MLFVYKRLMILAVLSAVLLCAGAVQAADKQAVAQSMKQRHANLLQAKDDGLIGEAWNGLVAPVEQDVPPKIQKLVQAENQDRKALFKIVAQETGAAVPEVALQNRIRMYRLAEPGHFVQDQERNWVRKEEF